MGATAALASRVDGKNAVDVEVLTELSNGHFLVRYGWPGQRSVPGNPFVVHRSLLVPMNNEAVACLGELDSKVSSKSVPRRFF